MGTLSWFGIVRLGLVQMAIGAVVVLTTSTLNRVMVVEMAMPAMLPGALVGLHYAVQITRPNWGFLSDQGGRRTVWIRRGMVMLAAGAMLATWATTLMGGSATLAISLAVLAFMLIGAGVGAAGTSVLALLASAAAPRRRAAAATITWLMMIAGIAITAGTVGAMLDPFTLDRLMTIVAVVCGLAIALTLLATAGIERGLAVAERTPAPRVPFREALAEIWSEDETRAFTVFVFVAMMAYFMQELILEPYAGHVFGFTPGESTALAGVQHGGVFLGMLTVGVMASGLGIGSLRAWTIGGCLASAVALGLIAACGAMGADAPLRAAVFGLGAANGIFAVAAIGSMMHLAGQGRERREGVRMGLWGAAQAIAAGAGGFLGASLVDVTRLTLPDPIAYGLVFTGEAALFLVAAALAFRIGGQSARTGAALVPGE